jgi:NAD(P)-dependent dehydrogenase (short-subunit alcohol dehydrogenase family)
MARIALITGGNRGLGRAAAHALADDGADIILTYRSNPAEAKAVVAEVEERGRAALALRLDMTDHETFPAFAGELRSQLRERWAPEQLGIRLDDKFSL